MIKTFKCREKQQLFERVVVASRWQQVARVAQRKLEQLNIITVLDSLKVPPNNRLEKLKGDRSGTYSIRINDRWRLCFCFIDGHAYDVEIIDYH